MSWQAWLTLAVTLVSLALLAREMFGPSSVLLGATVTLLLAGVITPNEAFAGFGNSAPITVAALYVLARAVEKTGLMHRVLATVLGRGGGMVAMARLTTLSAGASAFLNNTPLIAMLIGPVSDWATQNGRSPSRYLMPLSYAVILGGVVTVMGTSTNLVVSGMLEARTGRPMGLFEITPIGLPVAAVGVLILILTAARLLPERRPAREAVDSEAREFTIHMVVEQAGGLHGRTVEDAGLRHLQGVYLMEIERADQLIAPVPGHTSLLAGDRLCFVGRVDQIVDLQRMPGLTSAETKLVRGFDTARHTFYEAVVGPGSPLVGKTLKQADFRNRYQGVVVAIHRAGQRVNAKLGEVELRVGDTLLLIADPGFRGRWRDRGDFLLVSQLGGAPPGFSRKAWIVGLVTLGIVLVAGLGVLPMLQASIVGAAVLVVFGVLTAAEARGAVDLEVIIMIAASFGLGTAMEKSGLAGSVAGLVTGVFDGFGPLGVLLGIILATSLITEIVTNNAAAAIMFPIAFATANRIGADQRLFAVVVAVMASTSFLTPIGYQTNTMIYGPGGYRFLDYTRLGAPLTAAVMVVILIVARMYYGF